MSDKCKLCGRLLNQKMDPLSLDCGGDCWGCLGDIEACMGDPISLVKVWYEIVWGIREWRKELEIAYLDFVTEEYNKAVQGALYRPRATAPNAQPDAPGGAPGASQEVSGTG